jgi:hypothetical protein
MQFRAEQYYQASLERMRQALQIHRQKGNSALAIFCGGLAVECLLRAFRWTHDTSFEGRHDLKELFKASGLLTMNDELMRRRGDSEEAIEASSVLIGDAISEVDALWHNSLRYASEASLKAHLKRIGRLRGVKGNPLRHNAQQLLDGAQAIIQRGTLLWGSRRK